MTNISSSKAARIVAVIDLETVGFEPEADGIWEVAITMVDALTGRVTEEFTSLIRADVNKLRDLWNEVPHLEPREPNIVSDIVAAPTADAVMSQVVELLEGADAACAHNATFEKNWLSEYGVDVDALRWIDTCDLMRDAALTERNALANGCDFFGIELKDAHRAQPDTRATAELLLQLRGYEPELVAAGPRSVRR